VQQGNAEKKFRRLRGHKGMPKLIEYLRANDHQIDQHLDDDKVAA